MEAVAVAVEDGGFRFGLVLTAFVFGLRHGIDWDHIAAISDIATSQSSPRSALFFSTLYASGHGIVVFALGLTAVVAGGLIPHGIDGVMERFVGATLVLLGVYVFYSLLKHRKDFRFRSRWMVLFSLTRWLLRAGRSVPEQSIQITHEHEHPVDEPHAAHPATSSARPRAKAVALMQRTHTHVHTHRASMPDDPFLQYGRSTSLVVGMVHGIGAETPTQVLVFLAAVGAGGHLVAAILLSAFIVGLFASNSLIALAASYGLLSSNKSFPIYAAVAVLTGIFSLGIGGLFLFGGGDVLPGFFTPG